VAGYIIFGVGAALAAGMISFWCYQRIAEHRTGRGRRW
jgi:hypothetical protein